MRAFSSNYFRILFWEITKRQISFGTSQCDTDSAFLLLRPRWCTLCIQESRNKAPSPSEDCIHWKIHFTLLMDDWSGKELGLSNYHSLDKLSDKAYEYKASWQALRQPGLSIERLIRITSPRSDWSSLIQFPANITVYAPYLFPIIKCASVGFNGPQSSSSTCQNQFCRFLSPECRLLLFHCQSTWRCAVAQRADTSMRSWG